MKNEEIARLLNQRLILAEILRSGGLLREARLRFNLTGPGCIKHGHSMEADNHET